MFDKYAYVKRVTNQVENNYNTFQQVSGSLIKTHPDSIFLRFDKGSELEKDVFSAQPRLKVRVGWYETYEYNTKTKKPFLQEREITVLQVLLSHDSSYVCEVVVHYVKGDEQYSEEKE